MRPGATPEPGRFTAALPLSADDLGVLASVNRLRAAQRGTELSALEARLAARYHVDRQLAVYGSLAPGRSHHRQLSMLRGTWHDGLDVRGRVGVGVHGSAAGYPLLHWSPAGAPVAVELFVSDDLPAHWPRLDAFEGESYRRLLVPVLRGDDVVAVANVYAAAAG